MDFKTIRYVVDDRVATVTLHRPEQMNALNDQIVAELHEAMSLADRDRAARVIVLTGAGRAFCAGGDIGGFGATDPKALLTKLPRPLDLNRRVDYQMRHIYFPRLRKPVIGMINGATAGLGLIYALACDLRFASDTAVFTTAFARRGLSAEYGMAWILARVVGQANALDLLLSARKVLAPEAKELGLVNKVFPAATLADETYAYAREMAQWCSPRSMRVIKEQVHEVPFQTLHEAVLMANRDMVVSNAGADFREGTASFREKRPPRFQDDEE
ncbi:MULTISPECIES: enoyl-CoA hydratase [Xanthobacter]|uniref:enoyl-CoA hydratase n=1 Tax=Xanthobacter TaxID=279 RepID=UPI0035B0028A